jgi:anti-sigma factor RsiW
MDCKEFREIADLHIDGELSAEAAVAAVAHLNGCRACRAVEADLLALRRTLKRVVAQHEPPPQLLSDVRQLTRPPWRKVLDRLRATPGSVDETSATPALWKKKVSLPAPVFALLLVALVSLGAWGLWARRSAPHATVQGNVAGVERSRPSAVSSAEGGLDLSRYDGGERASLYKIRQADLKNAGQ